MSLTADDRVEILDTVAAADLRASRRDVEGYLALATDDLLLTGSEGTHQGKDLLRGALAAVWAAEPAGTHHVTTTITVTDTPAGATAHSTLLLITGDPTAIIGIANITQHLRQVEGRWLISERTVHTAATEAADPAPEASLPHAADTAAHFPDRPGAFFSALLTEHFVLESARGITVSESGSRASLYLMTLSSSLVAFGFIAQTPFAWGFLGVIVPVNVILGLFTYERLVQTSLEDVAALAGIQRIRRLYGTILPGATTYFPVPTGPVPNQMLAIGQRGYRRGVFFTISTAIGVINSILAGVGIALLTLLVWGAWPLAIIAGFALAIASVVLHGMYQEKRYARLRRILTTHERRDARLPSSPDAA